MDSETKAALVASTQIQTVVVEGDGVVKNSLIYDLDEGYEAAGISSSLCVLGGGAAKFSKASVWKELQNAQIFMLLIEERKHRKKEETTIHGK